MTIFFASHQIIIRRQRHKSGLRYGLSSTGTVQDIDLQPVQSDRINQVGGEIGKTYEAWCDGSIDVKEGDQIKVIETSKIFSVRSVSTYENSGLLEHHYLILMSQD